MMTKGQHLWQAKAYHENSSVQLEAAKNLINLLKIKGDEHILDVGCGDGKVTSLLSNSLKKGFIIGSDFSKEMIDFASRNFLPSPANNLKFVHEDAQDINYPNQFDMVFSSFALQWVPDVELFFHGAYNSLKSYGRIACTIPLTISDAMEEALAHTIQKDYWSRYFFDFKLNYYLRDENQFRKLLLKCKFNPTFFQVIEQKWVFPSRKELEDYTLNWLPHLDVFPEHLQEVFFKELIEKYIDLVPPSSNGEVRFYFDRIDFIAEKINT